GLAEIWLQGGDHARAAKELDTLQKTLSPSTPSTDWKELAEMYQQAADLAAKDSRLSAPKRKADEGRYRAASRSALLEAGKALLRETFTRKQPGAETP